MKATFLDVIWRDCFALYEKEGEESAKTLIDQRLTQLREGDQTTFFKEMVAAQVWPLVKHLYENHIPEDTFKYTLNFYATSQQWDITHALVDLAQEAISLQTTFQESCAHEQLDLVEKILLKHGLNPSQPKQHEILFYDAYYSQNIAALNLVCTYVIPHFVHERVLINSLKQSQYGVLEWAIERFSKEPILGKMLLGVIEMSFNQRGQMVLSQLIDHIEHPICMAHAVLDGLNNKTIQEKPLLQMLEKADIPLLLEYEGSHRYDFYYPHLKFKLQQWELEQTTPKPTLTQSPKRRL